MWTSPNLWLQSLENMSLANNPVHCCFYRATGVDFCKGISIVIGSTRIGIGGVENGSLLARYEWQT